MLLTLSNCLTRSEAWFAEIYFSLISIDITKQIVVLRFEPTQPVLHESQICNNNRRMIAGARLGGLSISWNGFSQQRLEFGMEIKTIQWAILWKKTPWYEKI